MARHKTSTHLKIIAGRDKKDPQRFRDAHLEPEPEGPLGEPPEHFGDEHAGIWREIAGQIPNGVLGNSDRVSFEMLCKIVAMLRSCDAPPASWFTSYCSLAGRFGLSPADRTKIKVDNKPSESGFDDF